MAKKTFDRGISHQNSHRASAEELLEGLFLDLAKTDPRDTAELLRGLGAALQIASTAVPVMNSERRDVWRPHERESYRSRKTWQSWILRQKSPGLGDQE